MKPELLHALNELQGESFTVAELTKHYLEHPKSLHKANKPARQFIYRNMVRMIKSGLMDKLPDDGGWPKYRLSQQFKTLYYKKPPGGASLETVKNLKASTPKELKEKSSKKPVVVLRERLNKHRSDMLCALGEAEEYESLCRDLPELSEEAQSLYAEARERSTLLLGKIKALESLLSSSNIR